MVTRALIGIDGISGEIKYDPGLGEVAVLEWGLRRSWWPQIEIGDVGNRGVNQRESHSFFEDHYRLVALLCGVVVAFHHHIEIRNLRRSPVEMMELPSPASAYVMTVSLVLRSWNGITPETNRFWVLIAIN